MVAGPKALEDRMYRIMRCLTYGVRHPSVKHTGVDSSISGGLMVCEYPRQIHQWMKRDTFLPPPLWQARE